MELRPEVEKGRLGRDANAGCVGDDEVVNGELHDHAERRDEVLCFGCETLPFAAWA